MGIKRSVFSNHIQRKPPYYKIMKNSQVGPEKLEKTADFLFSLFSTLMLLDRMFLNIFLQTFCYLELGFARRIF